MNKLLFSIFIFISSISSSQTISSTLMTGAEQMNLYLPQLKGKQVALLVNQTSVINQTHLVDTLLSKGIQITKIFAPEHGFRGNGDAGEHIQNSFDDKTKLPILSMYGSSKKPSNENMKGIDIVVFDIQDVGARFYTYISSLQYMMEACAENNIPLLILDRPNPNGFYVDGPVMETAFQSFVGMQKIPIVYGMTIGEYALMLNGEHWLSNQAVCSLQVISCKNYTHSTLYQLPFPPSPNLKSANAIYLYPSLCLFEGTDVSVGRGTPTPFEIWGHPDFSIKEYSFTPMSMPGAKKPLHMNETCFGENLNMPTNKTIEKLHHQLNISFLKEAYSMSTHKDSFFNSFFVKLAGTSTLKKQIIDGISEEKIRNSWEADLTQFKKIRRKYLLYKDFE